MSPLPKAFAETTVPLVILPVENQVRTVTEAAAGQQDGHVFGIVVVAVAEVAAVEDHGLV